MKVRFLDLSLSKRKADIHLLNFQKMLLSGKILMGDSVEKLENKLSSFVNRKYSIGVGSGTDALIISLLSLDLSAEDEIITTSLSWISTTNAIVLAGAKPVFADIDDDLNISINSVKKLINKKTKAILAVNFTGKMSKMIELEYLCKSKKIKLIEDASQSFGASIGKRMSCSFGDISAVSHNPMKIFSAYGEAGSIFTNNKSLYNKMISLRYSGTVNKEYLTKPSINGRMDTIQASVLIEKFKEIRKIINIRKKNAKIYNKYLSKKLLKPQIFKNESIFYTYTIRLRKNRDRLKKYLENKGVETKIQHPILIPQQKYFKSYTQDIKNAKILINQILCIPIHEKLSSKDIKYVYETINNFVEKYGV